MNTAVDWETDQRLYSEWLAFAPIELLSGSARSFEEYKRAKPKPKQEATMDDIEAIKKHFNLK